MLSEGNFRYKTLDVTRAPRRADARAALPDRATVERRLIRGCSKRGNVERGKGLEHRQSSTDRFSPARRRRVMLRSHSHPTQQPTTATWNSQGSTPAFPSAKPLDD